MLRFTVSTFFLLFLAACGSETATFAEVQDQILTPSCAFASCHSTANAANAGMLDLTAPSYDKIVNVASLESPGKMLVVPSDVGASYLVNKIENVGLAAGTREMPPGMLLAADRIDMVKSWIEGGAAND